MWPRPCASPIDAFLPASERQPRSYLDGTRMPTHMKSTHNLVSDRLQWDRQPSETSRQFACFREYRDMHPLDRSLAGVGQKLGRSTSYLERLSSKFHWVQRVAAFDREQDRVGQAKRIRAI